MEKGEAEREGKKGILEEEEVEEEHEEGKKWT